MMVQRLKAVSTLLRTVGAMLLVIWRIYPRGFLCMIFFQVVQGLFPLGTAWITKLLFDALAQSLALSVPHASSLPLPQMVVFLLIFLVICTVLSQLLLVGGQYLNSELERRLSLTIQTQIYKKVSELNGLSYFEDPALYNAIQLAANGARLGPAVFLRSLMTVIASAITLGSFLAVLLAFNRWLTAIILLATLPQFFVQWRSSKQRFGVAFRNSPKERLAMYYGQIMAGSPCAKEVRLFNLSRYFLNAFINTTRAIQGSQRKQQQRVVTWQALCTAVSTLVGGGSFFFVFLQAFRGLLSFGDVSLYMNAVSSIQSTLLAVVFASAQMNEQILFFRQYLQLLAMPQSLPTPTSPCEVPALSDAIELRDVSFRYSENHPWVLRHVNLRIPAGKCLALVGLNGAGKTTLVKLLARLYDVTEGQVLWDGTDIREFDPQVLRQHIAALFQDFMRYDLTARENVGLGDPERIEDTQAIEQAALQAGIHEFISGLPQGYNTVLSLWLGEKKAGPSVDLSGGEWQKIALARMFMRKADLFMLDEPTASLDAQSEYDLHARFADLTTGKTCLLITHRFSTVRMADAIAVLQDGQIVEYGTHRDLLFSDGIYAHLYRMQAGQYEPSGVVQTVTSKQSL
jgi:ATP-binding cassette, subfamily B, bacterial